MVYQKQWNIPSNSDPSKTYKVSLKTDGTYVCHCWPFLRTRKECSHILLAKSGAFDEAPQPSKHARGDILLQQYAQKGYRYYTWFIEPMMPWSKRDLDNIKRHPFTEDVRTFAHEGRRIVVLKEKPQAYQAAIANFTKMIGDIDFRRVKKKDREDVKNKLRKDFFDLTQYILYNKSGVINPNLPDGSVYLRGTYGQQLNWIEKEYKWLR